MVITFCLVVHSNEFLESDELGQLLLLPVLHSDHRDGFSIGDRPTLSILSFPDIVLFMGL